MIDWLNDNSGAVQAVATCTLVVVTVVYAFLTWRISNNATKQAKASVKMAEEMRAQRLDVDRPYLLIEVPRLRDVEWREVGIAEDSEPHPYSAYPKLFVCRVFNAGRGPAKEIVATALQTLVAYDKERKDVLAPGDSWDVALRASESLAYIEDAFSEPRSRGIDDWMRNQGIDSPSIGQAYDCGLVVGCTDIHDRPWATYLKFGLMSTTDNVRKVVTSRTLVPVEHRIIPVRGHHDS